MLLEAACAVFIALVIYHHVVYPAALRALTHRAPHRPAKGSDGKAYPTVTLIVPAFNEGGAIAEKIRNCAALRYAQGKLRVVIACDGCTDNTVTEARAAIERARGTENENENMFELIDFPVNQGKVAVLNNVIARTGAELVALSDTTAFLEADAIERAAAHFAADDVGFVTGAYDVNSRDPAISAYWAYQKAIKQAEAALAAPIGAHGAFYMFRRAEWTPLEPDTINDDVILPMRIVQRGFTGAYDKTIIIQEAEQDAMSTDLRRRRRLAAGGLQQALRLWRLGDVRRPGLAFCFLSGKALRAFMPFIMIMALVSNALLAPGSVFWSGLLALQLAFYCAGLAGIAKAQWRRNRAISAIAYLVAGHLNGLVGATNYLTGGYSKPWKREKLIVDQDLFMPRAVIAGKRALDIIIASAALVAFVVLFVPISLAIKLESKGPIFYRQLRVGLRTSSQSRLFYLTKFRTMRADAEAKSGAVWATKSDPRITRVGKFLRRTRLDELPQCIDVLRGDMSIVGPRPERPQFFVNLETSIPFYTERTYGLKPGITGLAQVKLPYDSSIEDVRTKVLYDHAYAMQLTALGKWLLADMSIILRTFTVMVLGKGQ